MGGGVDGRGSVDRAKEGDGGRGIRGGLDRVLVVTVKCVGDWG